MIRRILPPEDEAGALGPVHKAHRAVMAQEEIPGNLPDGRPLRVGVAPDCQEELVLDRREAHALGLSFAPAQEPAQSRPQLEKCLIVGILDSHIVLRYRYAICLRKGPLSEADHAERGSDEFVPGCESAPDEVTSRWTVRPMARGSM